MNKYKLILGISGVVLLIIFWNTTDKKIDCDQFISNLKSEKYSGRIIKKFIDKDQHNYKKVILKKGRERQTILLDQEEGGLFEYLKIGDSISKKRNKLKIRIKRGNKDSIYQLDYYCLKQ